MKKIKFVTQEELDRRLMKKPGFKKAYDDLELEFAIIGALIDARAKHGMTQEKLAKKIGTKQSAIARLESGRSNPTFAFIQKLSEALDLKLTVTPRYAKR
ncbi:MAG: helix-turn-helix transcriptional regulator [Candidatus Kaiserbacteria bacterium]|nr:helix-turn-helix transcriptional regulator [Candidatus Kaiserbacteria bacterium]